VGNLPVTYGKCCRPVPPDPIVAYLTRARGAVVHRQDCPNVRRLEGRDNGRLLAASWDTGADTLHAVELLVRGSDRPGLLRDVLAALAAQKINPLGVNAVSGGGLTDLRLTVEVRDLEQLQRLLAVLAGVRGVRVARRSLQGEGMA
jgi:GTP pyrophosphokinase